MKKKGKKFTYVEIEGNEDFTMTYGTVDKTTNSSVYLDITSWVIPLFEDSEDADTYIKQMRKSIKTCIYDNAPKEFNRDMFIVDLDLRESGIRIGKKSFMSIDITLYTNVKMSEVWENQSCEHMLLGVVDMLLDRYSDKFVFYKSKKT
tara:strand:+ start:215 stop:658 length:444 start_codon:yes stop_codon:yes gene_type:complete